MWPLIPFDPKPGSKLDIAVQLMEWEANFEFHAYFTGPKKDVIRIAVRRALSELQK